MSSTKFNQDLNVTGNITLSGNVTANGNVILGDADTDSISLTADITSNIVPNTNVSYDLGTSTKSWREVFTSKINSVTGDDLDIHSGSDIAFYPTGNIWIKQDTKLIFEGTVPDDYEIKLQALAATADRNIILPDEDGTLATREWVNLNGTGGNSVESFDFGYIDTNYHTSATGYLLSLGSDIDMGSYAAPSATTFDLGSI